MARKNHPRTSTAESAVPILAVLSNDPELTAMVQSMAGSAWSVVKSEITQIPSLSREPNVKVVIFDDQSVPSSDRGWALTEVRRCASRASIIYVTGEHDHEKEKQARARGVLFYTAKPIIAGQVKVLLQRQLQM